MNRFTLDAKVAVVTHGSRGIGRVTVAVFAEHLADVMLDDGREFWPA